MSRLHFLSDSATNTASIDARVLRLRASLSKPNEGPPLRGTHYGRPSAFLTAPLDRRRGRTGIEAAIGAVSQPKGNIMSNTSTKTRPSHRIYSVSKKEGDAKSFWTEIGAAWPHKDGKGFSLKFEACPYGNSEIVIRVPRVRAEAGAAQ